MNAIEQVSLPLPDLKEEYEKRCYRRIMDALAYHQNNKQDAAKFLGIKRTTLVQWLIRHAPETIGYRFKKKTNRKTGGKKKK